MWYVFIISFAVVGMFIISGCSTIDGSTENNGEESNNSSTNNLEPIDSDSGNTDKPITITVMSQDWSDTHAKLRTLTEEAFPHVELEIIVGDTMCRDCIEEALTAGIVPDIIFSHRSNGITNLIDFELGFDMSELIDRYQFDMSKFDARHIEEYTSWTNGEIWLLPFMADRYALHYNQDIFDQFGVSYPTDGMTWSEVIGLASEVTGEHDGIQYHGLHMPRNAHFPLSPVAGNEQLIHPDSEDVLWTENPFVQEYLMMVDQALSIPGNTYPEGHNDYNTWGEHRTLAMKPKWFLVWTPEEMNWDIVTYPQWHEAPGVGPYADGWAFGITAPSEKKDIAFELIQHWYSDENIMLLAETPLHAPYPHLHRSGLSIQQLEETHPQFIGKNLESLWQLDPAGGPNNRSRYDRGALDKMLEVVNDYEEKATDINSFLRTVREQEQIRIEEEKLRE